MKNKVELKKALLISIIIICIATLIFGIAYYYQYKKYTKVFNEKLDAIVAKLEAEYPNLDKNEIVEILNSSESENVNVLKEYGIDLNKDSIIAENDLYFYKFLILNLSILVILGLIILIIFLVYNKHKDKKLQEITNYIKEINNKNYKLDIDDNTEDELSILKNELYKVTIMLKEAAENSKKDKLNLKNSLSDISHQLKTPLTSIIIMIDNILDNKEMPRAEKEEFLKDIKREVININFLVNSLLKLSKLDSNTVTFSNKKVYIQEILQESIKNVSILCDLKNIAINVNGNNDIKVNCDFKWQVEAITNILKNCIEYSEENSKININFDENKMYVKVEIKDEGIGIDEKDLPYIFERFYKGKNSSNDSIGIGLALSKTIIENSNGYITVESDLNKKGTSFIIKYLKD